MYFKNLQGAVLVIGSLYWENSENALDKTLGAVRENWRNEFLALDNATRIKSPIRYGRKSQSRHNTYTMIFSNSVPILGYGYLIPFKVPIIVEENFEPLYAQALRLAKSEGICKPSENITFANWGLVALYINPVLKNKNPQLYENLTKFWRDIHSSFNSGNDYRINASEESSVTDDAFVNFDIPFDDSEIDYIFCTPVKPKIIEYPDAKNIADEMIRSKYYTYFKENINNGITTFQDLEIKKNLPYSINFNINIDAITVQPDKYAKTERGKSQMQKDVRLILGDKFFEIDEHQLCKETFKVLSFTNIPQSSDNIEAYCAFAISEFERLFGFQTQLSFDKSKSVPATFLQYFLDIEKIPGVEKKNLEAIVKEDLEYRTKVVEFYEEDAFIQKFKRGKNTPHGHEQRTICDFYLRNLQEQQIILKYFLNGIEERAIEKSRVSYNKHAYFDQYYDRPYLSANQFFSSYFDHRQIDKFRHRLQGLSLSVKDILEPLYADNKRDFYTELQNYFSINSGAC